MKSKKGQLIGLSGAAGVIFVVVTLIVFLGIPLTGIIKFLVSDKTPFIFLGILVLLFILKGKKNQGGY